MPDTRRGEGPGSREDVVRDKAAELAKQRAASIAADLKSAKDFAAAAKKAGLEVKTTELIARGAAIPDLGVSDDDRRGRLRAARQGGVSDAITTPPGTAIVRVVEQAGRHRRSRSPPAAISCARSWSTSAATSSSAPTCRRRRPSLKINIKQDVLAQVVGERRRHQTADGCGSMPAASPVTDPQDTARSSTTGALRRSAVEIRASAERRGMLAHVRPSAAATATDAMHCPTRRASGGDRGPSGVAQRTKT